MMLLTKGINRFELGPFETYGGFPIIQSNNLGLSLAEYRNKSICVASATKRLCLTVFQIVARLTAASEYLSKKYFIKVSRQFSIAAGLMSIPQMQ